MQKLLTSLAALILGLFVAVAPLAFSTPTFAADGTTSCTCDGGGTGTMTEGAILSYCDCGHGESVKAVINLVINILSVGVGIIGAAGITIVGIQYLTAGGNEEQTRKAKRRLLEIVLGLAFYAVAYALLAWLLPGFGNNS